ncbi:MAG: hypothetical protein HY842_19480 [Bacteroidetes bacterium]|nr:hypothetical protein [Bacteroidota bacterium]
MKSLLFLFGSVLFFQNTWQEFSSGEGRFRISVPGNFTEKTDTLKTEVGPLAYHTFFIQTSDETAENLFYMVSYCDYPPGVVFADSTGLAEEFFQNTMEAAAESVEGEILYSADIQLDKYPGKQWRIDYLDGKAVIKTKAYLVGSRFYSLQTIAWKDKSLNADATRFFDSFRLVE